MSASADRTARAARPLRGAGAGAARRLGGPPRLLAIDLGGTKALAGVFAAGAPRLQSLHRTLLACADFDGFEPLLDACLRDAIAAGAIREPAQIRVACVGLAGPVGEARARLTNLPWEIDAAMVAEALGGARVVLVNDFAAAAAGIAALEADAVRELQRGAPEQGAPRLLVGAGTGLGSALLLPDGDRWRVLPGEGGHAGFAPRTEREVALWRSLAAAGGKGAAPRRVEWEDVVSGGGIETLYRFFADAGSAGAGAPGAARISQAALADAAGAGERDPAARDGGAEGVGPGAQAPATVDAGVASAALDAFASAFGAFAGDAALLTLPRGGVYLAGGIAPRVFDVRRIALFLEAFADKGARAPLMRRFPVRLVLDTAVGMLGAAVIAGGERVATARSARPRRR